MKFEAISRFEILEQVKLKSKSIPDKKLQNTKNLYFSLKFIFHYFIYIVN